MRIPFSLYMALKYIRPKRTFLSVISVISVVGVVLGVAVLIIVLSVMSGFDNMWRDKILSFNSHITVFEYDRIHDWRKLIEAIERDPDVKGAAPYLQGLVFVQHDDRIFAPTARGIIPEMESKVSEIPENIISGTFDMMDDQAVIGSEMAKTLGVGVGDELLIYYPQNMIDHDELILPTEVTVVGIFELGMWEYDLGFMFLPMIAARDLFMVDDGVHAVSVMTRDPLQADRVATRLASDLFPQHPGCDVRTWMQLNRQLFSVLKVEKNMMFFLLVFIILVAAFGITNTLIVVVVQKTREVGVLKSLGFTSRAVTGIFFWQACIQGVIGTLLGLGLGMLALAYRNDLMKWLSNTFHLDLFPKEFYRLNEIPATVSPADVLLVAGLSIVICTVAAVIPAYRAMKLNPAEALRYE